MVGALSQKVGAAADKAVEPIYVSEVVDSTMDPTFRHIDWSACGPGVLRLGTLTVRVWARSDTGAGWRQLLELALSLRELHYLGKSVGGKFSRPMS